DHPAPELERTGLEGVHARSDSPEYPRGYVRHISSRAPSPVRPGWDGAGRAIGGEDQEKGAPTTPGWAALHCIVSNSGCLVDDPSSTSWLAPVGPGIGVLSGSVCSTGQ